MKTNPLERLKDIARRRPLTPAEQAELKELLAATPTAWPEYREEQVLTRLLTRLPAATVSSNFSARVMREIATLESAASASVRPRWFGLRHWMGRLGWTTAVVALSLVGWTRYQTQQRTEYVHSLTAIGEVASVPSVEVLRDFEVIHTFARVPSAVEAEADVSLLAALQ